jgi:hypothetical protein
MSSIEQEGRHVIAPGDRKQGDAGLASCSAEIGARMHHSTAVDHTIINCIVTMHSITTITSSAYSEVLSMAAGSSSCKDASAREMLRNDGILPSYVAVRRC